MILVFLCFFVVFFCSGSAGRVMLSKEDREAAKMGLSVFTVRCQSHCPWKVQKYMEKGKKRHNWNILFKNTSGYCSTETCRSFLCPAGTKFICRALIWKQILRVF